MVKLDFEGQVYEVGVQKESIRKPSLRLVQYNPFKHLSSLYTITTQDEKIVLFDDGSKAYRWINLDDPKGYVPVDTIEYLEYKRMWLEQQRERMSQKGKEYKS